MVLVPCNDISLKPCQDFLQLASPDSNSSDSPSSSSTLAKPPSESSSHSSTQLFNWLYRWPSNVPAIPTQIDVPLYIASLTSDENSADLHNLLIDYLRISDEARNVQVELLQLIQFLSTSEPVPSDQLPHALKSMNVKPLPSAYVVGGPVPRLASILRLRMAQDRQLRVKLQQAKLVVNILELQEVGSKRHLDSAFAEWEKAVSNLPSAMLSSSNLPPSSSPSPSFHPASLYPVKLLSSTTCLLPPTAYPGQVGACVDT